MPSALWWCKFEIMEEITKGGMKYGSSVNELFT